MESREKEREKVSDIYIYKEGRAGQVEEGRERERQSLGKMDL